jgi:hypothetical protein
MTVSQEVKAMTIRLVFFAVFLFASIEFISRGSIGLAENACIVLIAAFLYQFLYFYDSQQTSSESLKSFGWFERQSPAPPTPTTTNHKIAKLKTKERKISKSLLERETFMSPDLQKGVFFTQTGHVAFSSLPTDKLALPVIK